MHTDTPMRLNLGCGNDFRPGWVNADGFLTRPDIIKVDISSFPYPWADNTFDEVLMSHVLEHVPIIYRDHNGTQRDIIFNVFEEVHRILKPGGLWRIRVPYAGTQMAFCHPQHYRQIQPSWAGYVDPTHGDEAYYSTARFKMTKWRRNRMGMRADGSFPIRNLGLTSHLKDRLPFLTPFLVRKDELEMWWQAVK